MTIRRFTKEVYRLDVVDSESKEQDSYREVGQYVTRAWIVSRSVSLPTPSPSIRAVARGSRASNTGACVILKVRHRRETDSIPFCGFLDTHRFCKISVRPPRYYFGRELLRGRPIDSDRRTREAFNNGERVSRFSVSRMRVVVMLIYNLAIRVVF